MDERVTQRGYGTSSEFVRELIRKDADGLRLRGMLLQGATSAPTGPVDASYFSALRERVQNGQRDIPAWLVNETDPDSRH